MNSRESSLKSQQVWLNQKLNDDSTIVYQRLRDNQLKALNRSSSSAKCGSLSAPTALVVLNSAPTIRALHLARIATLILLCQLVLYRDVESHIMNVRVGALLEESNHEQANMFIRTIKMINERKDETIRQMLNISDQQRHKSTSEFGYRQLKLEPMIEFLADRQSSFEADTKVCQLIESGVQAIVGPTDGASIQHVQSICDNLEMLYFELRPFLGSPAASSSMAALNAQSQTPTASKSRKQTDISIEQANSWPSGGRGPDLRLDGIGDNSSRLLDNGQQLPESSAANNNRDRPLIMGLSGAATASSKLEDLTLNLYPPAHLLTSAYIDLIYAWNWTSFAIVYEDGNSMVKLQDLFKESSGTWKSKWQIKLFQFNPNSDWNQDGSSHSYNKNKNNIRQHNNISNNYERANAAPPRTELSTNEQNSPSNLSNQRITSDQSNATLLLDNQDIKRQQDIGSNVRYKRRKPTFRDIFWRIKQSGEQNILLDVKTENLYEALKQAQQVGCMTEKYSYLLTSLDLHTIDLEDFKYSRTRITAFSIIQISKSQADAQDKQSIKRRSISHPEINTTENVRITFDEKYLEKLGVYVIQSDENSEKPYRSSSSSDYANNQRQTINRNKLPKYKLSPSITLEKTGSYMEPPSDVHRDWSRREMLMSLPASMGLLPSLDRDNELKLFEFFIDQQERNLSRVRLLTSSAILHDSLILYMLGLNELDPAGSFVSEQQPISCTLGSQPWLHGSSLMNYMRRISFQGLTGPISFDQRGLRSDFKLDMMGLAPDIGLIKVGEWYSKKASEGLRTNKPAGDEPNSASNSKEVEIEKTSSYDELSNFYGLELKRYQKLMEEGVTIHVPYTKPLSRQGSLLVNEIIFERLYREQADQADTLIVTTKLSQPYFMLKETPNKLEGNDQYEGFAVDLIHELSKLVNFKYRWREVADKKYGSKEEYNNGTVVWNGMIGEIVRGQADLAIVDLTITAQREEAVDFTLPFMNTGISILFKKPTTKVTTLFSFLSPFSSDVWAYVLAAYCGISANLFFVGHLSPYEWANPHSCRHSNDDDEMVLRNQFSLLNSFWFTIGSLMQQGSDLTPRSMSTRTIAGIWYFFTLIMISSYTANLAAFLTVEKVVYPIENVRDLSNQQEIKYGCVESGSTCTFFHDSQIETYKRIDETMRKYKTYVRSIDEGQKRVEEGKFAFFMESASIEYVVERNCNLTQIGGLLDSKGYGLATSKKSRLKRPYRTLLSEGILHLQETGMLHILKNRWWKEKRGGGTCTDDGKGSGVTELSLANVGGVFVVLLGGLGLSFLVAIAEFMWRARRGGSNRDRMCEEMMTDLKFALACKSSTKPVARGLNSRLEQQKRGYLARQQSSLISSTSLQYDQLDCAKDCDPVLFHAMLTMLIQQQQHHQQQQQADYLVSFVEGSNPIKQREEAQHQVKQPLNYRRMSNHNQRRPRSSLEHAEQHNEWMVPISSHKPPEACKKRLLFAQQTIDMADDSFLSQQESHHRSCN